MKKAKRILAMIAVIIIIALYLCTIILSFFKSPEAHRLFMASLIATIIFPVMIYGYIVITKAIGPKDK